jgi:hypothetical protein
MVNNIFLIVALTLGLVACGDGAVKSEVKSLLIDPSSAEFKSIAVFKDGNYCGEVNSKNRMGGYAGFKAFSKVDGRLEIHDILRMSLKKIILRRVLFLVNGLKIRKRKVTPNLHCLGVLINDLETEPIHVSNMKN